MSLFMVFTVSTVSLFKVFTMSLVFKVYPKCIFEVIFNVFGVFLDVFH